MRHPLKVLFLILFLGQGAVAQESSINFDNETFTKLFKGRDQNGDKFLEFVRESESFKKWTKLIGLRHQKLPGIANDPQKAAKGMARVVKMSNPDAQSRVIANPKTSEALIDFLTWPSDRKFMEFNVFRFVRSPDGNAVVSLQIAYRFTDTSAAGINKFREIRKSWINKAVAFDMDKIHATLARH